MNVFRLSIRKHHLQGSGRWQAVFPAVQGHPLTRIRLGERTVNPIRRVVCHNIKVRTGHVTDDFRHASDKMSETARSYAKGTSGKRKFRSGLHPVVCLLETDRPRHSQKTLHRVITPKVFSRTGIKTSINIWYCFRLALSLHQTNWNTNFVCRTAQTGFRQPYHLVQQPICNVPAK